MDQVAVYLKPVLGHAIYIPAEGAHRTNVVIANFEHITPSSRDSTCYFEHVCVFWV